jgi:recombination protein RecA
MGQGRDNARQFLKDNHDIRREVDSRLRQGLGLPVLEDAAKAAAARNGTGAGEKTEKGAVLPMPEKKKA